MPLAISALTSTVETSLKPALYETAVWLILTWLPLKAICSVTTLR